MLSILLATMSVDRSQLKLNTHTSFHNAFFLLRVPLIINGQPAEIDSSGRMLILNSRYPHVGITFDCLFTTVHAVVKRYGNANITNYWCDDVPLFGLQHSTPDELKQFICSAEKVQNELASKISTLLAEKQLSSDPSTSHPPLPVVVHTEVFLLTPDPINKEADLVQVTSENLSTCLRLLKESEVFDFGSLFRAYREKSGKDHGMWINQIELS